MTTNRRRALRRLAAVPSVAVLALAVLTGCSDDEGSGDDSSQSDDGAGDTASDDTADDPGSDDGAAEGEPGEPEAGPGDGASTDIDLEDFAGFEDEVPEGFPEEVPLVDGDVLFGSEQDGTYALAINVAGEPADAHEEAVALLEEAGFEEAEAVDYDDVFVSSLNGEGLTVSVTTAADTVDEGSLVTYGVMGS
ncbi:hypothetical protein RDV89_07010 [Nocardioides zeae]|uniref:PASTA domain-containing protein n=1 Tax=Nocardioides imazamoxiresistens TaxID=3231893 RepID=A0ABU3PUA4_9ACTN|nr:hypothetical protein [Nocardioides zeae]MDT9592810.1 hypothetical protein [Nocardioides zeae]